MNKFILIKNGQINFNSLIINDIDIKDLMIYLNKKKIEKIEDIEFLISIYNKVYFLKKNNTPISLIINGKLIYINLLKINKSTIWIKNVIKKNNLNINRIIYAVYLNGRVFIIKG